MKKKLLSAILSNVFISKYDKLYFPGEGENMPDAYLRQGKSIFLFEFKDVLFPISEIEKADYESIKKVIDNKFIQNQNGRQKGISQLIKYIEVLSNKPYDFDDYTKSGIKSRNIQICPVIVFENLQFTLPGVNNYLNRKFMSRLEVTTFKHIYPLTLFSLDYIFLNARIIRSTKFINYIKQYHTKLKNLRKGLEKNPNIDKILPAYSSIEHTLIKQNKVSSNFSDIKNDEKYIHALLDHMNVPKKSH